MVDVESFVVNYPAVVLEIQDHVFPENSDTIVRLTNLVTNMYNHDCLFVSNGCSWWEMF